MTWMPTDAELDAFARADAPEVAADRAEQLRARLLAAQPTVTQIARRSVAPWIAGGAFAIAAAAVLLIWLGRARDPDPIAHAPKQVIESIGAARFESLNEWPDFVIRLDDGKIAVTVAALEPAERFRVKTADAEVEVRGTRFIVQADNGRIVSVVVERGWIELRRSGEPTLEVREGKRWDRVQTATAGGSSGAASNSAVTPDDASSGDSESATSIATKSDPKSGATSITTKSGDEKSGTNSATKSGATSIATKSDATKPSETKPVESKPGATSVATKAGGAANIANKPGDAKPGPTSATTNPGETKQGPSSITTKPGEAKPGATSSMTKPGGTNIATKPGDPTTSDVKPEPAKPLPAAPGEADFRAGWSALRSGKAAKAVPLFVASCAAASGAIAEDACFWAAASAKRAGRSDTRALLEQFLRRFPTSGRAGEAAALLGWTLYDAGDLAGAEAQFKRAVGDRVPQVRESAQRGLTAIERRRK